MYYEHYMTSIALIFMLVDLASDWITTQCTMTYGVHGTTAYL